MTPPFKVTIGTDTDPPSYDFL